MVDMQLEVLTLQTTVMINGDSMVAVTTSTY